MYAIEAIRYGSSSLGAARALMKVEGRVATFETEEEAKAAAEERLAAVTSPNITYRAIEVDPFEVALEQMATMHIPRRRSR